MDKAFAADIVAVSHLAYFSFVVLGQLLILVGVALRWRWVRNIWFRVTHLAAISIVGLEAIFGIQCPLTVWERSLREAAGQSIGDASFMAQLANNVMFHDFDEWVFTTANLGFAVLVILTWALAPPRRTRLPASGGVSG